MEAEEYFPSRKPQYELITTNPSAIAAAEAVKAQIQSAFIMALQRPRDILEARDRILRECSRPGFAEDAEYSKPIGREVITGPSIRFAELAIREWGNVDVQTQILFEDESVRRLRVTVTDLETNSKFGRDIVIKKTIERKSKRGRDGDVIGERKNSYGERTYILRATDEEMYTKEAAWLSRIIRNEGLRIIPSDIVSEGLKIAKQTRENNAAQDPDAAQKRIVDSFSSIGIRPSDLARYLEHDIAKIGPKEIEELRKIFAAIKDGDVKWIDFIAEKKAISNNKNAEEEFAAKLLKEFPDTTEQQFVFEYVNNVAREQDKTVEEIKKIAIKQWKFFIGKFNGYMEKCKENQVINLEEDQPDPFVDDQPKKSADHSDLIEQLTNKFSRKQIEEAKKSLKMEGPVKNMLANEIMTLMKECGKDSRKKK
jgi:hypothetical protein